MSYNPNSKKHKANHCGYKNKPTKTEVKALLSLYANTLAIDKPIKTIVTKKEIGTQMKINF
jgi:hypothetical protein